jgi:hypothetical protein
MRNMTVALMVAGLVALCGPIAQAGFVNPAENPDAAPFTCEFAAIQNHHSWVFDYDTSNPTLTLNEVIHSTGTDPVAISGQTDEDPPFTVVKTITNTSCITWTGYNVTLSGSAVPTFIPGSAGSTNFSHVEYPHAAALVFSGGAVAPGQLLTLQFGINVPTCGLFDFTLTQAPVPEPATLSLLSLGGLTLLRRRHA